MTTSSTEMELPDEILNQTLICLNKQETLEARCISKNWKSLVDRRNGIKKIPDEIVMHILIHLDTHDIFQARYISKKWKSLVDQEEFWRRKYGPTFSLPEQTLSTPELKHLQQCCIVVANMEKYKDEKKLWYLPNPPFLKCSIPRSLLPTQQDECQYFHSRFKRICLASTQDREVEEISNVLATEEEDWSKDIIPRQPESIQPSFLWSDTVTVNRTVADSSWSSAPSVHSEPSKTNEILLFGSKFGEAVITELAIKPEIDPEDIFFGVDEPKVYSWPQISIRIYCLPRNPQPQPLLFFDFNLVSSRRPVIFEHSDFDSVRTPDGRLNHRGIIQNIVGNQVPVYASPIMDVGKDVGKDMQVYSIPKGTIGNVVEITLYGKDVSHPVDNMFYACVERVAIRGVPLL